MNIVDVSTGKRVKSGIHPFDSSDSKSFATHFIFDWKKELSSAVYKLQLSFSKEVIGLISTSDIVEEYRVHINLLEVSRRNVGRKGQYKNIAGCLIAYCCRLSFEKGYDGFVSLIPKTQLIEHYQKQYGFQQFGRQLAVHTVASEHLIQKYL